MRMLAAAAAAQVNVQYNIVSSIHFEHLCEIEVFFAYFKSLPLLHSFALFHTHLHSHNCFVFCFVLTQKLPLYNFVNGKDRRFKKGNRSTHAKYYELY